jgi:hypothetical protein
LAPAKAAPTAAKKKAPPARITLSGPIAPLGLSEQTTIMVTVLDEDDQPTDAELKASANLGVVGPPVPTESKGTYTLVYTAPKVAPFSDSGLVKVTAMSAGQKAPVGGELSISFATASLLPPPALPAVSLGTEKKKPPSSGPARVVFGDIPPVAEGEKTTVRFHVEDAQGNRLAPTDIRLRSSSGTVSEAREEDGEYVAELSPGARGKGDLRVWAVSRGKSLPGEGTVVVHRAARREVADDGTAIGLGLGAFAGGLTNFGYLASPQLELAVDYAVTPSVRIGALGGFSPAGIATSGAKASKVSMAIVPLLARATYQFDLGPVGAHAGAMAGVALVSGQVTSGGQTKPFAQTVLDVAGLGGVGIGLGPGRALAELRMSRVNVDYKDGTTKVSGGLGGLSFAIGYRIEL